RGGGGPGGGPGMVVEMVVGGGRQQGGPQREDRIRVVADPSINALLVKAKPLDMLTIRSLLRRALDTKETDSEAVMKTHYIRLKYSNATEVASIIQRVYREKMKNNTPFHRGGFPGPNPPANKKTELPRA